MTASSAPASCDDVPPAAAPRLFVIHAAAEEWFVRGALLPGLGLPDAEVLTTSRLGLGKMALEELERGVACASVTVVVLSHAFVADAWSGLAGLLASHAEIEGHGQVVPLLLDDGSSPLHLAAKVALDLRDRARWEAGFARLRALLSAPEPVASQDVPCPYPGMRPYGAAEARQFYGREREILELVQRLRAGEREVFVVGPSGSGKSSLVAAGVLPRLARGVFGMAPLLTRSLRPGATPGQRLAEVLGGALEDPRAEVDRLLAVCEPDARVLLFIDQLEELFTTASPGERARFIGAATALRQDERVTLVWGLRADFFGELMESELWPEAGVHRGEGALAGPLSERAVLQVPVAPLRGEALRAAILRPALDVGVVFEPGLIERLLADAAGEPGALPLLQETLVQLWERRQGRVLPLAEYQAMSEGGRHGIAVAISRHGDACLRALPSQEASAARRILLRLVSLGESAAGAPDRRDTRRQQTESSLALGEEPRSFEAALEALARHRLVTIDRTSDGEVQVDLAHEALLSAWPALTALVRTRRKDEAQRRRLQAKVSEWNERRAHDATAGLLDAFELAEAEDFLDREAEHGLGQVPGLPDLVLHSRVERNASMRRRGEDRMPRITEPAPVERPRPGASAGALARHHGALRALAFSPDGARIATAGDDATARVWDAASGAPITQPLAHRAVVASVAFSADGYRLVTASEDQTARVWDAVNGEPVSPPLVHEDLLWGAALSPKGTRVVTACGDKAARVWQVEEGVLAIPPLLHDDAVRCAAFNRRGDRVVTASADGTARVWDVASGRPVGPPLLHRDVVVHAAFHPDGHFVVTASRDQTACIWEVETGKLAAPPLQHDAPVESVAFSLDGTALVTASFGYTLHRWSLEIDARRAGPRPPRVVSSQPSVEAEAASSREVAERAAGHLAIHDPRPAPAPRGRTARGSYPVISAAQVTRRAEQLGVADGPAAPKMSGDLSDNLSGNLSGDPRGSGERPRLTDAAPLLAAQRQPEPVLLAGDAGTLGAAAAESARAMPGAGSSLLGALRRWLTRWPRVTGGDDAPMDAPTDAPTDAPSDPVGRTPSHPSVTAMFGLPEDGDHREQRAHGTYRDLAPVAQVTAALSVGPLAAPVAAVTAVTAAVDAAVGSAIDAAIAAAAGATPGMTVAAAALGTVLGAAPAAAEPASMPHDAAPIFLAGAATQLAAREAREPVAPEVSLVTREVPSLRVGPAEAFSLQRPRVADGSSGDPRAPGIEGAHAFTALTALTGVESSLWNLAELAAAGEAVLGTDVDADLVADLDAGVKDRRDDVGRPGRPRL